VRVKGDDGFYFYHASWAAKGKRFDSTEAPDRIAARAMDRATSELNSFLFMLSRISKIVDKISTSRWRSTLGSYSNNEYVCSLREKCQRATEEFKATGVISPENMPLQEEILAVRYCSPQGDLDASIGGYLSSIGLDWFISVRLAHTKRPLTKQLG